MVALHKSIVANNSFSASDEKEKMKKGKTQNETQSERRRSSKSLPPSPNEKDDLHHDSQLSSRTSWVDARLALNQIKHVSNSLNVIKICSFCTQLNGSALICSRPSDQALTAD